MSDTNHLVDAYYAAWGNSNFDGLAALLAEDFTFHGAMDQAEGPAEFIALIRRNALMFGAVQFTDTRRVVDGSRAVNLYTFQAASGRVPMAEAFEVRDDRIARIDLYFDPAGFSPRGG